MEQNCICWCPQVIDSWGTPKQGSNAFTSDLNQPKAWSLPACIILLSVLHLLCGPVPVPRVTMFPAQKGMQCHMNHFPVASQLRAWTTELHCQHLPRVAYVARRCSENTFPAPRKAVELPFLTMHLTKRLAVAFSHLHWEHGSCNWLMDWLFRAAGALLA